MAVRVATDFYNDKVKMMKKHPLNVSNVGGVLYNRTINKEGETMDNEYIQELFDQAASGEISYLELQDYLDDARFDGDIIDFL